MKHKSRATRLGEALQKINDGLEEIQSLQEEMQDWYDNMSGTNLESTEKYETVGECADSLQTTADDLESTVSEAEGIEFPGMFG